MLNLFLIPDGYMMYNIKDDPIFYGVYYVIQR